MCVAFHSIYSLTERHMRVGKLQHHRTENKMKKKKKTRERRNH